MPPAVVDQKYLVRLRQLACRHGTRREGQPELLAQLLHRQPGDAFEGAAIGGRDGSVADHEHIEARPFCDEPLPVEQNAVLGPPILRFEQAAGQVAPVKVLHSRVDRCVRNAGRARDREMRAAGLDIGRDHPNPGNRERGNVIAAVRRVTGAAGPRRAAQAIHRHIGLAQAGAADAFRQNGPDPIILLRRVEAECPHRRPEPADVVVEPEERALPDADDVVGDVGTPVAPVEDRDRRLADRHEAAIDVGGAGRPSLVR